MENQVFVMFALVTLVALLASTTLFFGVMWRRERALRKRGDRRLEAQEASFAKALGSTTEIIKQSRTQADRVAALEREFARVRPVIAEMERLVKMNS